MAGGSTRVMVYRDMFHGRFSFKLDRGWKIYTRFAISLKENSNFGM
jgi:hypothetical protein